MRRLMFVFLFLTSAFSAFNLSANDSCFDPRTAFVQCPAGTEFKGWDQGSCEKGLVQGAICEDICFDPRVTFFQCAQGTQFVAWDLGTCEEGLVKAAICK